MDTKEKKPSFNVMEMINKAVGMKTEQKIWKNTGRTHFKKGATSWNKGLKQSEEHRQKNKTSHIGLKSWKKGKKETRIGVLEKQSKSHIGQKAWNKGLKMPEEMRIKMRVKKPNATGEKSHLWRGGITPINQSVRASLEYKLWRTAVFERDNYTCIWCGNNESGNLNADHIKRFSDFPELRFSINNGRTLCIPCHRTTETFGRK